MISGKFIGLIETNREAILDRVIQQIRREPEMQHLSTFLDSQLRDYGEDLLQHLGQWLESPNAHELGQRYERLGRERFEEDIPLHESVRALALLRQKILGFVEEHVVFKNAMELYAEEELDRRLGRFFDLLTVHMVRGYERAWRRESLLEHAGVV